MHNLAIIIDDDPISILVCETILRKLNFASNIATFKSAEAGLEYLQKHYEDGNSIPDFIFLDVQMPVMTGWDFLDIYQSLPNLPLRRQHVVMLSATFDPADQNRAADHPLVHCFLSKPITKAALDMLSQKV